MLVYKIITDSYFSLYVPEYGDLKKLRLVLTSISAQEIRSMHNSSVVNFVAQKGKPVRIGHGDKHHSFDLNISNQVR